MRLFIVKHIRGLVAVIVGIILFMVGMFIITFVITHTVEDNVYDEEPWSYERVMEESKSAEEIEQWNSMMMQSECERWGDEEERYWKIVDEDRRNRGFVPESLDDQ